MNLSSFTLLQKKDDDKNLKSKFPNNFYAGESSTGNSDLQEQHIPLSFLPRAISNKKMEEAEKEILETFRKVEVNITSTGCNKANSRIC